MAGGVDLKDSRQNLNLSFNLIWDLWRIKVTDHLLSVCCLFSCSNKTLRQRLEESDEVCADEDQCSGAISRTEGPPRLLTWACDWKRQRLVNLQRKWFKIKPGLSESVRNIINSNLGEEARVASTPLSCPIPQLGQHRGGYQTSSRSFRILLGIGRPQKFATGKDAPQGVAVAYGIKSSRLTTTHLGPCSRHRYCFFAPATQRLAFAPRQRKQSRICKLFLAPKNFNQPKWP